MVAANFILINLFIICYIIIAVFRTSRSEATWVKAIKKRLDPIIEPIGLYQFWGMFAPEPHHSNNSFVAHISFVSAPSITWSLQNNELSHINRCLKTRRNMLEKHALSSKKIQAAVIDYLIRKYQQQGQQIKEIKLIAYFQQASGVLPGQYEPHPKVVILTSYPIKTDQVNKANDDNL